MSCCGDKGSDLVTNTVMCHGCVRRYGPLCADGYFVSLKISERTCPRGRFVKDGIVRWWWIRWVGAPIPLRWWARLTLKKYPKLSGCGCIKMLKDAWVRLKGAIC